MKMLRQRVSKLIAEPRSIVPAAIVVMVLGCSSHMRPKPTFEGKTERPEQTDLIAAIEMPLVELACLWKEIQLPTLQIKKMSPLARWELSASLSAPCDATFNQGKICWRFSLSGQGKVEVMGRFVDRPVKGDLTLCAKPRLSPTGVLMWTAIQTQSRVQRGAIALTTAILLKTTAKWLDRAVTEQLTKAVSQARRPISSELQHALKALHTPLQLANSKCWLWRPSEALVSQPVADPQGLRIAARIRVRPGPSSKCQPVSQPLTSLDFALSVPQKPAQLTLPVSVPSADVLQAIQSQIGVDKVTRPDATLHLTDWSHDSIYKGVVRISAKVRGQMAGCWPRALGRSRGKCVGFQCSRKLKGRLGVDAKLTINSGRTRLHRVRIATVAEDSIAYVNRPLRTAQWLERWKSGWRVHGSRLLRRAEPLTKALIQSLRRAGRVEVQHPCTSSIEHYRAQSKSIEVVTRCPAWVVVPLKATLSTPQRPIPRQ
ncbi:MAG: hypothetical protein CMH53_03825 [Myxococcales bacterium]|nr:hypothetical protein [Myxococcales bacterium]